MLLEKAMADTDAGLSERLAETRLRLKPLASRIVDNAIRIVDNVIISMSKDRRKGLGHDDVDIEQDHFPDIEKRGNAKHCVTITTYPTCSVL